MADTRETLKLVKDLSRKEIVFALAHLPGSSRFVFGGSDSMVYDVDLASAKPEPRSLGSHDSYVTGLAIAQRRAISGSYDGRLIWWDLDYQERLFTVEAHARWIRDVAASSDGKTVASVADDMVCRVWDAETGEKRFELRGHEAVTPHHFPSMLYACAFSPDGRYLASGDKVGHVVIWDLTTGQAAGTLEVPTMYTWDPSQRRHSIGGIRSLAFSPDGNRLAIGGMGKVGNIDHLEGLARVEIFDWRKAERSHEYAGDTFKGLVERLVFLASGDRLLAVGGTNDGFLMLFDLSQKSAKLQEKIGFHVHDAVVGDASNSIFLAGHGKLAEYELKV
ncbi:MAG: repeat-containing protein [Planctomycetota bacterium]|nr:repeat-containing protein [Planctomycetota bacterium]